LQVRAKDTSRSSLERETRILAEQTGIHVFVADLYAVLERRFQDISDQRISTAATAPSVKLTLSMCYSFVLNARTVLMNVHRELVYFLE